MIRCLTPILLLLLLIPAVTVTATPGDTLRSIASPFHCPQGLTFDGTYLWNVDRRTDQIYKVQVSDGAVVDSIPAPGYVPRGLAWDGKLLWCADAEERLIYGINPATRIVERTIYCPVAEPNDLAWDGEYLWVVDGSGARTLNQISTYDGTTIISIPAPAEAARGLTYDGKYLWAADRYRNMIYALIPSSGEVILSLEAPGPHSWGLTWDGTHLWNVDYQTDRIYELVVDDGTKFARSEGKLEQVEFVHQVRNYGPDTVRTLDVYIAIPTDLNNQELTKPATFSPEPDTILTDKWGQKVAHFGYKDVSADEFKTATMLVDLETYKTRYFIFPDKVGTLQDIPKEITSKYLANDTKFSYDDPVIQNAVRKAVGDETNPYWIARNIFDYLIDHLEYERVGGWNIAPTVLARGNGSCSEYTFVYIAMCRAAGLPARYAGSVVIRGEDASYDNVYHRWVEVYLPEYGWIPVDPSGGDQKWPATQADYFGFLNNRFLITTVGGGGSEYLEWGYNANELWTSEGRCKIDTENFAEWSPLVEGTK
jgi:transglutaminase-like putative cysteine protease